MLMDERAEVYLKTFADGGEFPGGLAFRTALGQSNPDYSLDSLDRIDHLLDQIRSRFSLEYVSFMGKQANQNFIYLVGFYVGSVVARQSRVPIKWQSYEELLALWPEAKNEYVECFATSMSCLLGSNSLFIPLAAVLGRIFDPDNTRPVRESAGKYIVNQDAELAFRQPGQAELEATPAALRLLANAMNMSGVLTSLIVAHIAEGNVVIPTLASNMPNGQRVMQQLLFETNEEAINTGFRYLKTNPEKALQMALVYDAYIKLAHGRFDALIIEINTKYPSPYALTLALPYRPHGHEGGFMLHRIKLVNCKLEADAQQALMNHFYAGVHQNPQAAQIWLAHLDERI